MSVARTSTGSTNNTADRAVWIGVCVVLGVMLVRCLSPFDPYPYWSGDPFEAPSPVVGLTPAVSVVLDGLVAIGAAVACFGMTASELKRAAWSIGACSLAALAVLRHAGDAAGLDNFVYGSSLVSAFVGASIVFALGQRTQVRRIVLALLLGLVAALAVRALQQVYVEHPRTVETFKQTRDQFFRSQGWTADSAMAKAFERRLFQAEASGFFGLANVLATLGAAGLAVCAGFVFSQKRGLATKRETLRSWQVAGLFAATAGCGGVLILAGAKGGYAAAIVGLAVAFGGWFIGTRGRRIQPRVARLVGPGVVVAVLGAVVARGLIGERVHELSVLFRWYYMQAASRIFAEHPVWGVGSMGFKDAYLLAKNPLSPEEVNSPHSVLFDLVCTLGVGGVALALLWMYWVSLAGAEVVRRMDAPSATESLNDGTESGSVREGRVVAMLLTFATIVAVFLEREGATPDLAITRLLGLGVGVWVAVTVCKTTSMIGWATWAQTVALGAGAIACAAHCQIELTAVTPGASAWCLTLLAVAAAGAGGEHSAIAPTEALAPRAKRAAVSIATVLVFVVAGWACSARVVAWQRGLERAYAGTEALAEFNARRNALATGTMLIGLESDSPTALARDLGAATGAKVEASPTSIDKAIAHVRLAQAVSSTAAMPSSITAGRFGMAHFPTLRARSRLALVEAESQAGLGSLDRMRAAISAGQGELAAGTPFASMATYWAWVGVYEQSAAELEDRAGGDGDLTARTAHRRAALSAWERAHDLGPDELLPVRKLLELCETLKDGVGVQRWACECLRVNELLRLDPLEQLPADVVAHLKSLSQGG